MKQNTSAKNRSTPLNRLSEPISCDVLAYLCLQQQESFLFSHIAPAGMAIDASPSLSLSGSVLCCGSLLKIGHASVPASRWFWRSFWKRAAVTRGGRWLLFDYTHVDYNDYNHLTSRGWWWESHGHAVGFTVWLTWRGLLGDRDSWLAWQLTDSSVSLAAWQVHDCR